MKEKRRVEEEKRLEGEMKVEGQMTEEKYKRVGGEKEGRKT